MIENKHKLIEVLDIIISEYGWSIDYCLKLPHDVLCAFYEAILNRKHREYQMETKFTAYAVNAGFSGKIDSIDKIFKNQKANKESEPIDEDTWKAQIMNIWVRTGRDPKELEEKWKKGEDIQL